MSGIRRAFPRYFQLLAILLAAVASPGCNRVQYGDVSGTVTYRNKPLTYGSIVLLGIDGIPRTATIGSDASYSITGVPAGEVKVGVVSQSPPKLPAAARKHEGKSETLTVAAQGTPPPGWVAPPKKYRDPTTSELSITIVPGPNTQNIVLTD
jgi:hypothetical protein